RAPSRSTAPPPPPPNPPASPWQGSGWPWRRGTPGGGGSRPPREDTRQARTTPHTPRVQAGRVNPPAGYAPRPAAPPRGRVRPAPRRPNGKMTGIGRGAARPPPAPGGPAERRL